MAQAHDAPEMTIESTMPPTRATRDHAWAHLGGWRGLAFRLGLILLAAVAASAHVLRGDSLLVLLAIAIPGALLAGRRAMPLAIYAAAWFAFSLLRAVANDLGLPDQGGLAADLDRVFAFGTTPTERAQDALYSPGAYGIADYAAIWVHTSYYVAPHLVAVALWWRGVRAGRPKLFDDYLRATLLVMAFGLLLYVLLPTSPPWLQGTKEDPMSVYRITRASNAGETQDPEQVYTFFTDPNPVAAMPSLHTAFTVLLAIVLWRRDRRLGLLGVFYALAMGASLIYLGEHYLVDVLAGAAVAIGAGWLVFRRERRSQHDPEPTPRLAPSGGWT